MLVLKDFKEGYTYTFRKSLFLESLRENSAVNVSLYESDEDEFMWCNRCNNKAVNADDPAQAFVTTDDKSTFYVQPVWCEAKKKSI